MTEQERFQRAFAPLHAPSDTLTEVMKMTEQKHRKSGRRTAVIALAAALLLATGSAAYAARPWGASSAGCSFGSTAIRQTQS